MQLWAHGWTLGSLALQASAIAEAGVVDDHVDVRPCGDELGNVVWLGEIGGMCDRTREACCHGLEAISTPRNQDESADPASSQLLRQRRADPRGSPGNQRGDAGERGHFLATTAMRSIWRS